MDVQIIEGNNHRIIVVHSEGERWRTTYFGRN